MLITRCAHSDKPAAMNFCLFTVKVRAALTLTSASSISTNQQRHINGMIMQSECSDWHQSFMLHSVAVLLLHPLLLILTTTLLGCCINQLCASVIAVISSSGVCAFSSHSHLLTLAISKFSLALSVPLSLYSHFPFLPLDHCHLPSRKWHSELSAFKESHGRGGGGGKMAAHARKCKHVWFHHHSGDLKASSSRNISRWCG